LVSFNRDGAERGQSVVEFALVLPLLVFLMVGIIDLARVYTTMLSVESAAREAADYGAFNSLKWSDQAAVDATVQPELSRRACIAASDLPDYVGPDTSCFNPAVRYDLSMDRGASWVDFAATAASGNPCNNVARVPDPCWVRVELTYTFNLLIPLNFEAFGVRYGLPNSLTFTRTSIYAMTDLTLPPTPPPGP
jgi:Flp pilus assembly protein TadG